MKPNIYISTITALAIFASSLVNGQVVDLHLDKAYRPKEKSTALGRAWQYSRPLIAPSSFMFVSGAFNGLMDLSRNNYSIYSEFFGITNHQWHDPRISWVNKYKLDGDGQPLQPLQPKFWLSTTTLVGTTDAWHAYQSGMLSMWSAGQFSYAFNISKASRSRKKWYWIVLDILIQRVVWQAGFYTTYGGIKYGWYK